MDKKRYYNFTLVMYEDDKEFNKQMEEIQQTKEAIWIKHDKDTNEEGDIKKCHYHVVLKLKSACTISALSKKLGVGEHMIEPVKKSLNSCLKYLIHFGDDTKYNYDKEDVKSNSDALKRRFLDLVAKDTPEIEKIDTIEQFILDCPDFIDWVILGRYVRKINMWDAFRRNSFYFTKIIDSHNAKIAAMRYDSYNSNEYWKDYEKSINDISDNVCYVNF